MSNETEKICLNGMIQKVERQIEYNEKKIVELIQEYPLFKKDDQYYNRPTEINVKLRKLEGELIRFNEVIKVLKFNEDNGVTHVHTDKSWIPETEKIGGFAHP